MTLKDENNGGQQIPFDRTEKDGAPGLGCDELIS